MSLLDIKKTDDDEMVDQQQSAKQEAEMLRMEIPAVGGVNDHERDAMDIAVLHEESQVEGPPVLLADHFLLVDDNKINLQVSVSGTNIAKRPIIDIS